MVNKNAHFWYVVSFLILLSPLSAGYLDRPSSEQFSDPPAPGAAVSEFSLYKITLSTPASSIFVICMEVGSMTCWWLSTIMVFIPFLALTQRLQNGINAFAEFRQSVLHSRRVIWIDRPLNDFLIFQLPELLCRLSQSGCQ